MKFTSLKVPPLNEQEKRFLAHVDASWSREKTMTRLKHALAVGISVELATLPIYLYTYYSIARTLKFPEGSGRNAESFPKTELSRFADKAGAYVMSVAVEEMLHLSLSSNVLFALGGAPDLYLQSPWPFPAPLPHHKKIGPDGKVEKVPLAKLSYGQLWAFLEIEYPAPYDFKPEDEDWSAIDQIYGLVRCLIESKHIHDHDFCAGEQGRQIQGSTYAPNNIDTTYAKHAFEAKHPVPPSHAGSAAHAAQYSSREDSHVGRAELLTVRCKKDAIQAITTICDQGEGARSKDGLSPDDDRSHGELSHYYKFLVLQTAIDGGGSSPHKEPLPHDPPLPPAPAKLISPAELDQIVFDFPDNPSAADYSPGYKAVVDVANGLYQYMLIMTETIFRVPPEEQARYFNTTLHQSMIWILDKLLRSMRAVNVADGSVNTNPDGRGKRLIATFENIDLGARQDAFATLRAMAQAADAQLQYSSWYTSSDIQYYLQAVQYLPDVSSYWAVAPTAPSKYEGAPKFPSSPPTVAPWVARHGCMGLNSCKGQGRTLDNACAGQGYCSTAMAYNPADPTSGKLSDHTCHVKNNCRGQGGCGLYGTAPQQNEPGHNACQTQGSCATPINAERFSTDGPNRGKSVWLRARAVFEEKVWPSLRENNPSLPAHTPPVPGTEAHPHLFANGPTIEWIEEYSGQGMTACGSSGMSGAGSCS